MLHQQIHHRSFLAFAMLSLACVTAHAATGDDLLVPFVTGAVPRDKPFFPWRTLNLHPYDNAWGIGSSGLPGEARTIGPTAAGNDTEDRAERWQAEEWERTIC